MHDFLSTETLRWVPRSYLPSQTDLRYLICLDYPATGPWVVGARLYKSIGEPYEWAIDTGDVFPRDYPLITHWAIVHGPDFNQEEDYDA